jgi:outer membrane protein TolC
MAQSNPITLRETQLKSFLTTDMPKLSAIELQRQQAQWQRDRFDDQYASFIGATGRWSETDDPRVPSRTARQSLNYRRQIPKGLTLSGKLMVERQKLAPPPFTPPPFGGQNYYTPVLGFGVEIDLWRNLWGHLDEQQRNQLAARLRQSKIKAKLDRKNLHMTLRSLYWQLTAQKHRIAIYRQLVASAKRGYRNIQSQLRDNIADQGSAAKLSANLSSAQAQLKTALIRQNFLQKNVQTLIPNLQGRDIQVAGVYSSIRQAVARSVACTNKVGHYRGIPYEYTEYDDLIRSIHEALQAESHVIDAYDSADVKLQANVQSFGLDEELGEAQSQSLSFDKTGYEMLLTFQMPLGELDRTEKLQLAIANQKAKMEETELEAEIKATHENLTKVIDHLSAAVDLYHESIAQLEEAFRNARQKFQQGRISVHDYLADQNALLESQIQVLDIEEQIIMQTLDYFKVYNQAPCEFNRI